MYVTNNPRRRNAVRPGRETGVSGRDALDRTRALQNRKQPYTCSGAPAHPAPVRMSGSSRPAVRSRAICPLALRNCGWHPAVTQSRRKSEAKPQRPKLPLIARLRPAITAPRFRRTTMPPHSCETKKREGIHGRIRFPLPFLYACGVLRITASANCRSCRKECSQAARRGCRASSPPMQSSSGDRT